MASNSNLFGVATQPPPPRLSLTAEERSMYGQLFKSLDTESIGVVTGEVARSLFERSGLSPMVLGRIWQIADDQNNGFLNQTGFAIAMRLIGYVQSGQHLAPELVSRPGPLPRFGESEPPRSVASPALSNATGNNAVPPLTPNDRSRFIQLFESSTSDSLLPGSTARDIFLRAQLPTDTLGQIWNLADIHKRGALDSTEFVIAMHLIQCTLNGSMQTLPQSVPPSLFTAAAAVHERPMSRSSLRSNTSTPQLQHPQIPPPVSQQHSGMPPPPRTRGSYSAPVSAPVQRPMSTGGSQTQSFSRASSFPVQDDWLITPQQKAHFDSIFATVDREGDGSISGEIAVPFFMTSKLPEDVLAQIWDLSDIRNSGYLSKDEFAVAMYLVQQRLSGAELPTALPEALVPPSLRQTQQPQQQTGSSLFYGNESQQQQAPVQRNFTGQQQQQQHQPQPSGESSLLDLFDIDESAFKAPAAPAPQSFSPTQSSATPQLPPARESPQVHDQPVFAAPSVTSPPPLSPSITGRQPFKPSSAFGQSLAHQNTGSAAPPAASVVSSAPPLPPLPAAIETAPPATSPTRSSTYSPVSAQSAQNTGSSPFGTGAPASHPQTSFAPPPTTFSPPPQQQTQQQTQRQFEQPQISPAIPQVSTPVQPAAPAPHVDEDRDIKQKISEEAVQFGKLSTEISTMTTQTTALKDKRAKAEAELAKMVHLRTDIDGKLRGLRTAYESEVSKVRTVEQQLAISTNETAKLRSELAELEAEMHTVQVHYQEIMSNLEADQNENATLKEKIRFLSEQSASLKAEADRAREESRQQKGMVASNRNQLMNAEAELGQQKEDLASAKSELAAATAAATAAAAAAVPAAAAAVSSAGSVRSVATNPFFSNNSESAFSSPAASPPVASSPVASPAASGANSASIFESMFADFGSASEPASTSEAAAIEKSAVADSSEQHEDLAIAEPSDAVRSVETSESSSLPRTGYEDSLDEEMPSPATTTTTATTFQTNNAGPISMAAAFAVGGAAAGIRAADLESVSSSVQNNAPESVREGISRPESPNNVTVSSVTGGHSARSSVSVVTASEGGDDGESAAVPQDSPVLQYTEAMEPELSMGGGQPAEPIKEEPAITEPTAAPAEETESTEKDPFGLKPQAKEEYAGTREQFDAVFSGLGLLPKSGTAAATTSAAGAAPAVVSESEFSSEYPPVEEVSRTVEAAEPEAAEPVEDDNSSSSDDEGPEELGATMRMASRSPPAQTESAATIESSLIPSEPPAYSVSDPSISEPSAPAAESSQYSAAPEAVREEPEASTTAPTSDDIFASYEESFASAPVATTVSSSVTPVQAAVASPFDFAAPSAPAAQPDAFDSMFASFSAPTTTAGTAAAESAPPLPPKVPLSAPTSSMPGGFGAENPVDEFESAFASLEDSKIVTSEEDPAMAFSKKTFDESAFADFDKF
ncbi:hypothetical protein BZA70DRAFT_79921 [Myxozyma melibiosi]|uniref:Uncharacterized protein n=1 Tax=Myxozyma melibiosi TaxID=54550 RepID=A0ABR1F0R1_9ASCO